MADTTPVQRRHTPRLGADLSGRELQILHLLSMGLPNGEVGKRLFLAEQTIKTHNRRIFLKLGARDRAHAVRRGFELGLLAVVDIMPADAGRQIVHVLSEFVEMVNGPDEPEVTALLELFGSWCAPAGGDDRG